jgi:hypothetical protein
MNLADTERQSVIPLPDVINIMSMFTTIGCLVVMPIATDSYMWLSRMILGGAYVLLAFYPITVAAHHRLWTRAVMSRKPADGAGFRYANSEELLTSFLSVLVATAFATYLGRH